MTAGEIYALPMDANGWRRLPSGNEVTLGNGVTLGDWVKLGDGVTWNQSPLQIQGSRHLVYVADADMIGVGCVIQPASWWLEHYAALGLEHNYTEAQIEEYKRWLDIAKEWQEKLLTPAEKAS